MGIPGLDKALEIVHRGNDGAKDVLAPRIDDVPKYNPCANCKQTGCAVHPKREDE